MTTSEQARYPAAQQRAARLGWALAWTGREFELSGNGSPAAFGRLERFEEWIGRIEKGKSR